MMRNRNQLVLPINYEVLIDENDPVWKLVEICDTLDYTRLYDECLRHWRAIDPVVMFMIIKKRSGFDCLTPEGYTYVQTASFVLDKAQTAKSVLLIVNTKEAAKSVYTILKQRIPEEGTVVMHLSTHMCPSHRKSVLEVLRRRLKNGERVICVSTQLIEAGVDISFETVIRSLAGLDSIIQSAGRCNRNQETDLGQVYIIRVADEKTERIKEIRIGAALTERLMITMRKNPALFGGDITCDEAINRYYRDYYNAFGQELDFPVTPGGIETSIFDLLSTNTRIRSMAKNPNRV